MHKQTVEDAGKSVARIQCHSMSTACYLWAEDLYFEA